MESRVAHTHPKKYPSALPPWARQQRNFQAVNLWLRIFDKFIAKLSIVLFYPQKMYLRQLYGKNQPSNKKVYVCNELKAGKVFQQLSKEVAIAKATTEVYGIDCLAIGMDIDHEMVARYIRVTPEDFQQIKSTILSNEDKKASYNTPVTKWRIWI